MLNLYIMSIVRAVVVTMRAVICGVAITLLNPRLCACAFEVYLAWNIAGEYVFIT